MTKFEDYIKQAVERGRELNVYVGDGFVGVAVKADVGTSGNGIHQPMADEQTLRRLIDG